jgi:hypothetical protein
VIVRRFRFHHSFPKKRIPAMSVDVSKIPDSVLQPLANVAEDLAQLAIDQGNQTKVTAPAVTAAEASLAQAQANDAAALALIGTDQQHVAADQQAAVAAVAAWTTPLPAATSPGSSSTSSSGS